MGGRDEGESNSCPLMLRAWSVFLCLYIQTGLLVCRLLRVMWKGVFMWLEVGEWPRSPFPRRSVSLSLTLALIRIDKSKALSLLLHAADISHPTKQWSVHSRWTKALMEEFFRQVTLWMEPSYPWSASFPHLFQSSTWLPFTPELIPSLWGMSLPTELDTGYLHSPLISRSRG